MAVPEMRNWTLEISFQAKGSNLVQAQMIWNSTPVGVIFKSLLAQIDARTFEAIGIDLVRGPRPDVLDQIAPLHARQKLHHCDCVIDRPNDPLTRQRIGSDACIADRKPVVAGT